MKETKAMHIRHLTLPQFVIFLWLLRYCPDANLLKLQDIARNNHHGCIWSGITKAMVLGSGQTDHTASDEDLQPFVNFDQGNAERGGYPLKTMEGQQKEAVRFHPWHERALKAKLETATRSEYNSHLKRQKELPYGFIIDMQSDL